MNEDYNYDYNSMNFDPADYEAATNAGVAIAGAIFLFFLVVGLAFYIYLALSLQKIAKKTNTPNGWFAWIPILNIFLIIQVAKKPLWWVLLMFIPFLNIIFAIFVWMEVARAVRKPEWWGILIIVPFVNLVVPGYLAFSSEDGVNNSAEPQNPGSEQNISKAPSDG